jgi:hypothetical protein
MISCIHEKINGDSSIFDEALQKLIVGGTNLRHAVIPSTSRDSSPTDSEAAAPSAGEETALAQPFEREMNTVLPICSDTSEACRKHTERYGRIMLLTSCDSNSRCWR